MSLGQTMISIAALVAITVMVVTSQRYLVEGQKQVVSAEIVDLATMHGEALLSEILRKEYDATTKYNYLQSTSEFTLSGSLGPNASELAQVNPWPDVAPFKSNSAFTDVDDYDGYLRTVTPDSSSGLPSLSLSVVVYYVSESNPNGSKVTSTTYLKRVIVTVSQSTYLSTPLKFTSVVAY